MGNHRPTCRTAHGWGPFREGSLRDMFRAEAIAGSVRRRAGPYDQCHSRVKNGGTATAQNYPRLDKKTPQRAVVRIIRYILPRGQLRTADTSYMHTDWRVISQLLRPVPRWSVLRNRRKGLHTLSTADVWRGSGFGHRCVLGPVRRRCWVLLPRRRDLAVQCLPPWPVQRHGVGVGVHAVPRRHVWCYHGTLDVSVLRAVPSGSVQHTGHVSVRRLPKQHLRSGERVDDTAMLWLVPCRHVR